MVELLCELGEHGGDFGGGAAAYIIERGWRCARYLRSERAPDAIVVHGGVAALPVYKTFCAPTYGARTDGQDGLALRASGERYLRPSLRMLGDLGRDLGADGTLGGGEAHGVAPSMT